MSTELIGWIQSIGPVGIIAFLFKRWVDQVDKSLNELKEEVQEMAVKNVEDHGEVSERIGRIEEQIKSIQSPWKRASN